MARGRNVNYALHVLGLVSLVLFMQRCEATTFTVGGSKGWSVPSDNSPVYNQWAERMRFQIGDSLLFVYPSGSDSVLEVTKDDYTNCNTASPLAKHTDGHTEFKFNQSGPHYFISGNKDNCNKNEKLVVIVLADRTKKSAASPPSPPPSPTPDSKDTTTVPAPSPNPLIGTTDGTTTAPSAEENPSDHNGAASFVMSFVGSIGAFVGSSLLLAF